MTVKMPEPAAWRVASSYWTKRESIPDLLFAHGSRELPEPLFTAAQLEAYAAAKVAEEQERCARICEAAGMDDYAYNAACDYCAAAIRGEK